VAHNPTLLVAPATLVVTVAMLSTALMRSDLEHRSEAVIDPLTGMLNRNALSSRVGELEQQSALSGEPIGLILADLDHFKQVNDSLGHAIGDAVLKDVSYVLRKQLRAFDLAYRLGGEEFLVLLPGADSSQTHALAEELREAVSARSVGGGVEVTLSLGVSASERGEAFDYAVVFAEADAALYEAKRSGRDRVCGGCAHAEFASLAS
jgi:diguanylate cyclase (GGDEF)-like protein